jgi:hypothetical protein
MIAGQDFTRNGGILATVEITPFFTFYEIIRKNDRGLMPIQG